MAIKKKAAKKTVKEKAAKKAAPSRKTTRIAAEATKAAPAKKKPSFPKKTNEHPLCVVGIGTAGGGLFGDLT